MTIQEASNKELLTAYVNIRAGVYCNEDGSNWDELANLLWAIQMELKKRNEN